MIPNRRPAETESLVLNEDEQACPALRGPPGIQSEWTLGSPEVECRSHGL